jgi:two-component system chemotaxis response regulator CheY
MHRVLVAEDNPGLARVIAYNLRHCGFDVTVCHRGDEAWTSFQASHFEALVSDFEMPGLDGLSLARNIRGLPEFANMPIIMLTGRQMELDVDELKTELRLVEIFPKPFSPQKIAGLVAGLLLPQPSTN